MLNKSDSQKGSTHSLKVPKPESNSSTIVTNSTMQFSAFAKFKQTSASFNHPSMITRLEIGLNNKKELQITPKKKKESQITPKK